MEEDHMNYDEQQRRSLQEYIFGLEDARDRAEELAATHSRLKDYQNLLLAVLGSTSHGIGLIKDDVFAWCNKALTVILGWKQEELIGHGAKIIFPNPEEYPAIKNIVLKKGGGATPLTYEVNLIHRKGYSVPCLVSGRYQDEHDRTKGYVLSITDFTGLKNAEMALKTAFDRLEEHSSELVLANERLGKEIQEHKETAARLNRYRNHLEELVTERTEELKETNDRLRQEVFERKQQQEALRKLEELESTILGAISHAVLGLKEGLVVFANDGVETVFGWKPDQLIGQSTRLLYRTDEEYEEFNKIYEFLEKHNFYTKEIYCRHREGRDLTCRINASRIGRDLRDKQIVVTYENITDQKRLEFQLFQSQKMEAIGTLAGGVAHDINNTLMGIQGYVSLMLLDSGASAIDREKLKIIEELVKSGANLTRQLLGFARGGKYEVKPININDILMKTSSMFGRTKKEIRIHISLVEGIHMVEGDPGQIEQVLVNLFLNAWQAMPGGGSLYLVTENAFLDSHSTKMDGVEDGRYVKISITDTGVGMDNRTRERIFEPFFTTKEMARGTGLGLASVYGIVKNHGGFINVYSEKGHGSTFSVYLPASDKTAKKDASTVTPVLKGSGRILVVDDEPAVANICKRLLETLGYTVTIAHNGQEALALYTAQKKAIDLVILDMIMPEMGGAETFQCLKAANPDVRVILSSGYSMNGEASRIINQGCKGFIQKPFTIQLLSQRIREILEG